MNNLIALNEINGITKTDYNAFAFSFVENVRADMLDVRDKFFEIGFRLDEAVRCNYPQRLGYANIGELAEALFDIKKTTAYDLMTVFRQSVKYPITGKPQIDEKYKGFSQTQILAISKTRFSPDTFLHVISPADSVSRINDARVVWNKIYDKGCRPLFPLNEQFTADEFIEKNIELYNKCCDKAPQRIDEKIPEQTTNNEQNAAETALLDQPDNKNAVDPEETLPAKTDDFTPSEVVDISKININDVIYDTPTNKAKKPKTAENNSLFTLEEYAEIIRVILQNEDVQTLPMKSSGLCLTLKAAIKKCLKDNKTELKNNLKKLLLNEFERFDYSLTLRGNKQSLSTFFGVVSGVLIGNVIDK